jgi:hypothetical protein
VHLSQHRSNTRASLRPLRAAAPGR